MNERHVSERHVNERWCDFGPSTWGTTTPCSRPGRGRSSRADTRRHCSTEARPAQCSSSTAVRATSARPPLLWSGRRLVQVDDNPSACAWARRNTVANAVDADVRCVDLEALTLGDESFALVLADPPYVPSSETGPFRRRPGPRHRRRSRRSRRDPVVVAGGGTTDPSRWRDRPASARARAGRDLGELAADAGLDVDVLGTVAVSPDRAVVLLTRR